ncbi:MAG: hypothetical protein Q4P17_11500, partial [Methanobacterium sp.]|nr:hypothetical protein [Methanobacterium sp.]
MRKLNYDIESELKKYAYTISTTRKEIEKVNSDYKEEVAVKRIQDIIGSVKSVLDLRRNSINNLVDAELKKNAEIKSNQFASKDYQLTLSNMLKLLEMSDFNVSEEQFNNMIQPLVNNNDYSTLQALESVMKNKGKPYLEAICKNNSLNLELNNMDIMLNAIKQYVNTNMLLSIGGDIY